MIFKKLIITFSRNYFIKSANKKLEVSNFFNYIPIKKNCITKNIQVDNNDVIVIYENISKIQFNKLLEYIDSNENYKKFVSINLYFYEKPKETQELKMEEIYIQDENINFEKNKMNNI